MLLEIGPGRPPRSYLNHIVQYKNISLKLMTTKDEVGERPTPQVWDHSSHERFYEYYADASQSQKAVERFRSIRETVLRTLATIRPVTGPLDVADIGCGAGTQSMLWATLSHRVHGLDVNEPLLNLAAKRASASGFAIDFRLGSATSLPWDDRSMDVCLLLELLEHVENWQSCLTECSRVLRAQGLLVITTSSKLCPIQYEFNLPLYSWYPTGVKHYFEHLAATTRPELANYAKYPAVNWFSFYGLRAELAKRGLDSLDRFDVIDLPCRQAWTRAVVHCVRALPVLRWLGHVATPGTMVLAIKGASGSVGNKPEEGSE
jgi:ubiquinone/menaquinone biosynthesis C-methylase UbiE